VIVVPERGSGLTIRVRGGVVRIEKWLSDTGVLVNNLL
jgi:hypothetical protein